MKKIIILVMLGLIGVVSCATPIPQNDSVITVNSPKGGERWIAYETHDITWETSNPIRNVAIFYSKDNFVNDIHTITESIPNTGCFPWRIADDRWPDVKIRVCDAGNLKAYGESTKSFTIDYYTITWNLIDDVTRKTIEGNNLIIICSSGCAKYPVSSPFKKDYPYGTYTTVFSANGYGPVPKSHWIADWDIEFTLVIESSLGTNWGMFVDLNYDKDKDDLYGTCWFSRLMSCLPVNVAKSFCIEIYDQSNTLVKTLTSSIHDKDGVFHVEWKNTCLKDNTIYLVKTSCIVDGQAYGQDTTTDLRIPVRSPQFERELIQKLFLLSNEKADKTQIGRLIQLLDDDDWETREKATQKLMDIGKPAIEPLKEALKQSAPEVKMRASMIINKFNQSNDAEFYMARISLSLEQKEYGQVLPDIKRILEINPKDKDIYYNIGMICHQYIDNPELAIKCYEKYLELAPKDDPKRAQVELWKGNCAELLKQH